MRKTDLPSLNRNIGNGLQLKRELVRSVGLVEMHLRRAQAMPASRDDLVAFLQAGIDYLEALDDKAMGGLVVTGASSGDLVEEATRQLTVTQKVGGVSSDVTADVILVSSDTDVATVSSGGLITAVEAGTAVITVTSGNGAYAEYVVTVVAA